MMSARTLSVCVVAALILLGAAAYANSLGGKFVWDDTLLILDNKHIKNFNYIGDIIKEDLFHMSDLPTGYYRPVQTFSYLIDYMLWGKVPSGYHITNIILQIANSILVFYLCFMLLGNRGGSFFVAAVFCIHPAFVPIVGYISGRADLLGMFFALSAIYLAVRCMVGGKRGWTIWVAVPLYALALLSKEYYILTPLFIMIYPVFAGKDTKLNRNVKAALVAMCCVAVAYLILRATILDFHQSMGVLAKLPFWNRLAVFPWIMKNYMVMLIAPLGLSMEKRLVYGSFVELRFVLSYAVPALLAWLWYYLARTGQRIKLFWLVWFLLGIIPVCNLLFPLKAIWADHWAYMASIGFFACLVSFIADAVSRLNLSAHYRKAVWAVAAIYIVFLTAMTIRENRYWMNEEVLYARILETSPHSARTIYNQGKVYEEKGDLKRALESYNTAIKDTPDSKALYLNARGMVYKNLGDREKAMTDFEAAAAAAPGIALYHNNLGCIYAESGRVADARREWKRALEISPTDELASKNLKIIGDK